jgi:hypothetical protein
MIKTLIAVAVAGAFALPVAALASAASDNIVVAQAGGASGADTGASARQPGANPPGTASPGASRDTTTSTDRDTGAAARSNPSGATGASGTKAGFERLDRNGDGFISRDEAKDAMELNTRFSELDKNNDGKLSREEYNSLNTSTSGAAGATTGPQGVPGKGPGGQEAASRPLGSGDGKTGATPK